MKKWSVRIAVAFVAVASLAAAASEPGNRDRTLVVMSRNMDLGSDFGLILQALSHDPPNLGQVLLATSLTFQEIVASDMPRRASALAAEVDAVHPDVLSLQEVSTLRMGSYPGVADTVVEDQLALLSQALAARGLHYAPLRVQRNSDVSVPAFGPAGLISVGVTDYDVVMARTDLPVSQLKVEAVRAAHFDAMAQLPFGAGTISFPRGWIAVDVKLRGKPYRIVDTHLEAVDPALQALQAHELVAGPLDSTLPVILAADLNSDAHAPSFANGPAYSIVAAAGFVDAWSALRPAEAGFTWPLFPEDGLPAVSPYQRIDLVLTKGAVNAVDIVRTGVAAPFASDHAGVAATLVVTP